MDVPPLKDLPFPEHVQPCMYLSDPAQTLKDQGDGAGTQPATRSSGGDLSENSGHNHEDVLEPPVNEGRADQATMEVVSGAAEQSGNEQVMDDDTLSQCHRMTETLLSMRDKRLSG